VFKRPGRVQRFLQWLFGSPFQQMPDAFGDPVPAVLRVFEAQAEEIQGRSNGKVGASTIHSGRTWPA
jgi:hypothetical protein